MENKFSSSITALGTEQRNPATMDIDRVPTAEMVRLINAENRRIPDIIDSQADSIAAGIDLIADHMKQGGRLFFVGAGTSGRLGVLDASECPPTFSVPRDMVIGIIAGGDGAIRNSAENAEDVPDGAESQLREYKLSANDVVCGIAASGRTPYVIGALDYAHSVGAATISVSNNGGSEIAKHAGVAIEAATGPEALTGSTRLKAGTAQKMILNILSTGAMIKLGKTYRNLMIDVKASNKKLEVRCVNILTQIFPDRDRAELEQALSLSGGSVKLAAAMIKTGKNAEDAAKLLESCNGFLKDILED